MTYTVSSGTLNPIQLNSTHSIAGDKSAENSPTVRMVFLSMTKIPRTVNPIGSPERRFRNTFSCKKTFRWMDFPLKKLWDSVQSGPKVYIAIKLVIDNGKNKNHLRHHRTECSFCTNDKLDALMSRARS